jgi:hypothetical protein
VRRFLFQTIHDVALMLDRERVGREASPTGGVIDSQSVKAPEAKTRGYDAGKKIVGRKRHIAVDTDGRLLMVRRSPATYRTSSRKFRASLNHSLAKRSPPPTSFVSTNPMDYPSASPATNSPRC